MSESKLVFVNVGGERYLGILEGSTLKAAQECIKEKEMNGYVCFWMSKRCEVYADTLFEAKVKAVEIFQKGSRKKVESYAVSVTLAEKSGEQVVHAPMM